MADGSSPKSGLSRFKLPSLFKKNNISWFKLRLGIK